MITHFPIRYLGLIGAVGVRRDVWEEVAAISRTRFDFRDKQVCVSSLVPQCGHRCLLCLVLFCTYLAAGGASAACGIFSTGKAKQQCCQSQVEDPSHDLILYSSWCSQLPFYPFLYCLLCTAPSVPLLYRSRPTSTPPAWLVPCSTTRHRTCCWPCTMCHWCVSCTFPAFCLLLITVTCIGDR